MVRGTLHGRAAAACGEWREQQQKYLFLPKSDSNSTAFPPKNGLFPMFSHDFQFQHCPKAFIEPHQNGFCPLPPSFFTLSRHFFRFFFLTHRSFPSENLIKKNFLCAICRRKGGGKNICE